jgi:hypothetical protein
MWVILNIVTYYYLSIMNYPFVDICFIASKFIMVLQNLSFIWCTQTLIESMILADELDESEFILYILQV